MVSFAVAGNPTNPAEISKFWGEGGEGSGTPVRRYVRFLFSNFKGKATECGGPLVCTVEAEQETNRMSFPFRNVPRAAGKNELEEAERTMMGHRIDDMSLRKHNSSRRRRRQTRRLSCPA